LPLDFFSCLSTRMSTVDLTVVSYHSRPASPVTYPYSSAPKIFGWSHGRKEDASPPTPLR
jgi:hypothetical protein